MEGFMSFFGEDIDIMETLVWLLLFSIPRSILWIKQIGKTFQLKTICWYNDLLAIKREIKEEDVLEKCKCS